MLPRASRSLLAVRAFILAPATCSITLPLHPASSCATVPQQPPSKRSRPCGSTARFATTSTQRTSMPYALTAAIHTFEEQVKREELDFLPQAYEHLRQVVLESQRRGLLLAATETSILSEDTIKNVISLLALSPVQEHAALHLAIFNDLLTILHVKADVVHPLEFTAQTFQKHIRSDALDALPRIYDHMQHLASIVPDPRQVFTDDSAAWRAVSWMQRLAGEQSPLDLLPRILHDLLRLFGLQPTLAHHQLVIKGFMTRELPDEAWTWLRKMEQPEERAEGSSVWLKPSTEQYNLLLKYFAKRGDIVSVRMLFAHMTPYATPSQLSYHYYLAAILVASAKVPNQHARVADAVEELERAGHTVHLKTLGGVTGRGPLASWVPSHVFALLRAAQGRAHARRSAVNRKEGAREENTNGQEGDKGLGDETSPSEAPSIPSDIRALGGASGAQEPLKISPDIDPPGAVPQTKPFSLRQAPSENGISDASVFEARLSDVVADDRPVHTANETVASHPKTPSKNVTRTSPGDDTADESPPSTFNGMVDAVQRKNIEFSTGGTEASPASPVDNPRGESHGVPTEYFEGPPGTNVEDTPPSEEPRHETAQLSDDLLATSVSLPVQSEFKDVDLVDSAGLGIARHAYPERESDGTSIPSTNHSDPSSRPNFHDEADVMNDSLSTGEASVSPEEFIPSKPAVNGHNDRVRRRYSRLLYKTLENGDLREASKIYSEFTATAGPDVEFGGEMIKALCQGHLLEPPPRPHIVQALRIYQSLVEAENREGTVGGYFDGANRTASSRTVIGRHIYKTLLRVLSAPAPAETSSRDFGSEVYEEYAAYAAELLADMEARGFTPDDKELLSVVLLRFRAAKTHQEAFDHYRSIVRGRLRSTQSSPTEGEENEGTSDSRPVLQRTEYKTILISFAKLTFPKAPIAPAYLWLSIASDMRARGFAVTVEDYTRFLSRTSDILATRPTTRHPSVEPLPQEEENMRSMYAYVKDIHQTLVLDANISPDAILLNTLMNAYQLLGAFEDALQVFNLIWLSGRMDSVTPIIIFDACGHAGKQNIAYAVWCMLVAKGWRFDKRTLDTWVECLCRTNVEAACKFVCVYMGRENSGYLSEGDTRPDVQTCLILLKLSWLRGQNADVKERIKAHLPHIWDKIKTRYE